MQQMFLASKRIGGLSHVLPGPPGDLRTVFVPTAGVPYEAAPWLDRRRDWLDAAGFKVEELELSTANPDEVATALEVADLVYVEGGNTYYLLEQMQRCRFWEAMAQTDAVYAGSSAGAIVVCPDIGYIGGLDDRGAAPGLVSTQGAGLVGFSILPHVDDLRIAEELAQIIRKWPQDELLIGLDDDQALIVIGGLVQCVFSPEDLVGFGQSRTGNS
ncbi:MAG: Type 1 glutamine amidotransferase-like domain-containing protein [Nocardioides sp.]